MVKKVAKAIQLFTKDNPEKVAAWKEQLLKDTSFDEDGELIFHEDAKALQFEDWGSEAIDVTANPYLILAAYDEFEDEIRLVEKLPSVSRSIKNRFALTFREALNQLEFQGEVKSCKLVDRPRGWVKPKDWWC